MGFLEEIRENWKLDAKTENNERYFFHVKELGRILAGTRSYVIGRKGTGKTAISQFIYTVHDAKIFTEKLSFKNFPFNELYSLSNAGYTAPNQYITLWKYIIYSHICKMMARNEGIDGEVSVALRQIFVEAPIDNLQRWIKKWTAKDFSFSIFGNGVGVSGEREREAPDAWIARVDTLEAVIAEHVDDSKYYVVFDELDEDYKNILDPEQYAYYTHLLTGLFKAVQDIKSVFPSSKFGLFPIVFLRDDIYDIISDADKNKWDDFKIELDWTRDSIKGLIAFRVSRALDANGPILSFEEAWDRLFTPARLGVGHKQKERMSAFDFMARSTHLRPRDFIKYIQACASAVDESADRIPSSVVKAADKAFSNYLKRELIDELHSVIPEASTVFDVLSQIRKQTFSFQDFSTEFSRKLRDGSIGRQLDPAFVLKILFIFSVIGNQPRQKNQTVFRYLNKDAEPNFKENFVVHRGLLKSLQIL